MCSPPYSAVVLDQDQLCPKGIYGDVWSHFGHHNVGQGYLHLEAEARDADKHLPLTAQDSPLSPNAYRAWGWIWETLYYTHLIKSIEMNVCIQASQMSLLPNKLKAFSLILLSHLSPNLTIDHSCNLSACYPCTYSHLPRDPCSYSHLPHDPCMYSHLPHDPCTYSHLSHDQKPPEE